MKDIKAILSESGATLTDEQVKAISDAVGENYRSKEEMEKKASRIKELEEQNHTLSAQVERLKGDGDELEALRNTVEEYKQAEEQRKAQADEQAKRDQFRAVFDAAVGEQEFANDIMREAVFSKAYAKCSETTGLDAKKVIEELTKDVDGIWKNPQLDARKMPNPADISTKHDSGDMAKRKFASQLFNSNKGVM